MGRGLGMGGFSPRSVGVALAAIVSATIAAAVAPKAEPASGSASYTADGKLLFPRDYRSWIFLTSGLGMSYVEGPQGAGVSMFDNVFVDPQAYAAFQKTGTWPERAVLVLEVRGAEQNGSINKHGHFQTGRMAVEVHVKDTSRFKGGWAFFGFDGEKPGQLIAQSAPCYSCHEQHAAVDTTFVQFYPTLLPLAEAKKTLSANYLADEAAATPPRGAGSG